MKRLIRGINFSEIHWICVIFLLTVMTGYGQGTAFVYQGRLDSVGTPVSGRYDFEFTLFATNRAGTPVAGPITNLDINVANGLFTTTVDFGNVFTGTSNWLEIAVSPSGSNSFITLDPRQALAAVPYAVTASNVSGWVSATQIQGGLSDNNLPANPVFQGTVTAGALVGNGSGLTNLLAGGITGTLNPATLPGDMVITNPYELATLTNSLRATAYQAYQYGWPDYSQWPDGFNTWFWAGVAINESAIIDAVLMLKTNGLAACGLTTISIDEGLFTNRDVYGIPQMDRNKWPHGFPWLCNFIITNGFKVGIYSVVTNQVGLAADNLNNYIFGAEDVQANYFLTNGVTYYKVDSPINSRLDYPNEVDYLGNEVVPMANAWDNSYLRFVTDLRSASYPVFINASFFINTNGQFSPNIRQLLNSYRLTPTIFTNKLGMKIGGDITGGNAPLLDWNWAYYNASFMSSYVGGYFYPDFDSLVGNLLPDAQRKIYIDALFGSIFQFGHSPQPQFGSVYTGWYHNITNELGNPLIKEIRARQTPVRFLYETNGCVVYGKDNRNGGLDVLVLNENYTVSAGGTGKNADIPEDYTPFGNGVMQFTNEFSYAGTNYLNVFTAARGVLDFARLGLWSPKCIVTTVDNGGASVYATGSFSELVFAAGARLYTITPVAMFPPAPAPYRDLSAERYFLFWTTNRSDHEPIFNAFNAEPPVFGNQPVAGLQLGDDTNSYTSWGINGASSFTALTGVDGYGHDYGGHMTFLVDGIPVYTNPVVHVGYTNLIVRFSPTNQIFTICSSNRNFLGNPRLNYLDYALSVDGNGSGLTGLTTSQLNDFLVASNNIVAAAMQAAAMAASSFLINTGNNFLSASSLSNPSLPVTDSRTVTSGTHSESFATEPGSLINSNTPASMLADPLSATKFLGIVVTNFPDANGPLPVVFHFVSHGGTLLVTTSGSGFTKSAPTAIGTIVQLDGATIGTNYVWVDSSKIHSAFVSKTFVQQGVEAGTHAVRFVTLPSTVTDAHDHFCMTVQELPY